MTDSSRLPGARLWTGPVQFYQWFRQVDAAITSGSSTSVDLASVTARVTALESAAASGVVSFNGRSGVVVPKIGDYSRWFQSKDATLTAFAALTIAADSLTIGTGPDAFAQTTFAANTFPAKASTGALEAKPITDFALSLLDDADAAAARTTLDAEQAGTAAAAVAAHEALANPHPQYLTAAEGDAAYDALGAAAAAQAASQPLDATLTTLSGQTVTAFALTLLDDADAGDARTTLGAQATSTKLNNLSAMDATTGLVEQTGISTFAKRALGVAAATDVLTRADGDGRYDATGTATAVVAAHEAAGDPHPQYLTAAEGAAAYDSLGSADAALSAATAYADSAIDDALDDGTYTPTLTNTANISASTAYAANYMRVGNTVTVSGKVDITCTANSTTTELRLSLPVAATFTVEQQAGGTANPGHVTGAGSSGSITALASGSANVVRLRYLSGTAATASRTIYFIFTYRIP